MEAIPALVIQALLTSRASVAAVCGVTSRSVRQVSIDFGVFARLPSHGARACSALGLGRELSHTALDRPTEGVGAKAHVMSIELYCRRV